MPTPAAVPQYATAPVNNVPPAQSAKPLYALSGQPNINGNSAAAPPMGCAQPALNNPPVSPVNGAQPSGGNKLPPFSPAQAAYNRPMNRYPQPQYDMPSNAPVYANYVPPMRNVQPVYTTYQLPHTAYTNMPTPSVPPRYVPAPPMNNQPCAPVPPPQFCGAPNVGRVNPYVQTVRSELQENGIPVTPDADERAYIRKQYTVTGLLILFNCLLTAVMFGLLIPAWSAIPVFSEFFTGTKLVLDSSTDAYKTFTEISTAVVFPLFNLIVALVGFKLLNVKVKPFFKTKTFSAGTFLCLTVIVIAVQELMAGAAIAGFIDITDINTVTFSDSTIAATIASILYSVVGAPIFEELLFRGFVMKSLSRYNVLFGMIASSLLFGMWHQNIGQLVNASIVGMIFAYAAYKTNSILTSIFLHSIANFNAVIMQNIINYNEPFAEAIWAIVALVFITAAIIIICVAIAKKQIGIPVPTKAESRRGIALGISSWGLVSTVVILMFLVFVSIFTIFL